jgi:transcriptional regulator with XRE-family HTH domain
MSNELSTPAELESDLGEQLKAERLRKNMTMDTLAELAGVSVNTVRSLEAGKGGRVESLIRVARALARVEWLTTFRPQVKISPLQIAKGNPKRQRASRNSVKKEG